VAPPLNRTNHALIVPEETSYDIIADVYDSSAILQLADVRPMTAAVENVVISDGFTWPAGMENVAEGTAKPVAEGAMATYELVAKKMAVFVVVTDELLADSPVDIIAYYQSAITQRFQQLIDIHAIAGGGPFGADGLEDVAGHSSVIGTAGHVDLAGTFADAFAAVEDLDYAVTGTLAARRLKSQLRVLRDGNDRPLYIDSLVSNTPDQIYGEPILYVGRGLFTNTADDTQAITGDFSKFVIGIREQLQFSLHSEGTVGGINLLETNQTALRAEMRLGGVIADADAFAKIVNAAA